jgi:hypothetical protein
MILEITPGNYCRWLPVGTWPEVAKTARVTLSLPMRMGVNVHVSQLRLLWRNGYVAGEETGAGLMLDLGSLRAHLRAVEAARGGFWTVLRKRGWES